MHLADDAVRVGPARRLAAVVWLAPVTVTCGAWMYPQSPWTGVALAWVVLSGWAWFTGATVQRLVRACGPDRLSDRIRRLPRSGPVGAVALLAVLLSLLIRLAWRPWLEILSGNLFVSRVLPWSQGNEYGLHPYQIHRWLMLWAVMTAMALPYVAMTRWVCDRRSRRVRVTFAIGATLVGLCLLVLLSRPAFWLLQYTWSIGVTVRRLEGLAFVLAGYVGTGAFLMWALRSPRDPVGPQCAACGYDLRGGPDRPCPECGATQLRPATG